MPIEFANPAMLWGTSLAALPLLLHLFNRKRARPHQFAAIDFVLRSRRRTARRLRLKRLLLFLVRTLLLLLVPLALARPQPKRESAAVVPSGPSATALVLDTSLSMGYALDGQTLLERAKVLARDAVARLAPEDPVTLVTCGRDAPPPAPPGFDRGRVREGIDAAQPTWAPQDLTACIARAARALGESAIPSKRILLASDLTAAAFRLDVPASTIATEHGEVRPEVVLLDAAGGAAALPNVAITGLRVEPATSVGHRAFQFTFTVVNHGDQPRKDLNAVLKVGDDVVAKGFLDLPAHGSAVKTLIHRFPAGGGYVGSVGIAGDALGADDLRHFALNVPRDVKALVVNGEPHPVRFLDEAFFVEAALNAPGSPVRPTLRDAETALLERWADYDLVLLLNVRELPEAKARELRDFVMGGGGLFVSMGGNVDSEAWNGSSLGELLPRPLHLVKTAADPKAEDAGGKAARLARVDFEHPALSVFTGEAREGLVEARTYRYYLLSSAAQGELRQLASFDDGAPALLEARRGRGRVILYTSTVDREWTDWPIRTSFLPAIQRMAGWLTGILDERALEQVLVGEAKGFAPPADAEAVRFTGPDGKELAPSAAPGGQLSIAGTELPGVYLAKARREGAASRLPELDFAVNVDPRESDLGRLEEGELKAYFGEKTRTRKAAGEQDAPPRLPYWSVLLAVAVGLFFSEGLLLRK